MGNVVGSPHEGAFHFFLWEVPTIPRALLLQTGGFQKQRARAPPARAACQDTHSPSRLPAGNFRGSFWALSSPEAGNGWRGGRGEAATRCKKPALW